MPRAASIRSQLMIDPRWLLGVGLLGLGWAWTDPVRGADAADRPLSYEQDVRPILKAHCFQCHGEEAKPKAKLDLRLARLLIEGGMSGAGIVLGHHEESLLWE